MSNATKGDGRNMKKNPFICSNYTALLLSLCNIIAYDDVTTPSHGQ